jgi:hypothetical protein
MSNEQSEATQAFQGDQGHGGHVYMQTNETQNAIIHYLYSANGTITEAERILTNGPRTAPVPGVSARST